MSLSVESLTHVYPSGVEAVRDVSLTIGAGESVALVGQNGAGKTSLVKHFNGLLQPTRGSVRVGARDTRSASTAQLAAQVGYVFQNPDDQLFQPTVQREVAFGPRCLGRSPAQTEQAVAAALARVGLGGLAARHPYDLAYHQRKLVALAAVLAMETPIIVLDEPTTGQDFGGAELLGRLVDDLHAEGRTLIAVSHDIDFCAEHFERVIVMGAGRLLADGPARAVLSQAELLAQTDVEPPQLVRLAARLGVLESMADLTVEGFVTAWLARRTE